MRKFRFGDAAVVKVSVVRTWLVAALVICGCAALSIGRAQPPKLPDILGITTGMAPQEAYKLLKEHDPGHTVALQQWTIPQLYGDKPITLIMNAANTGREVMFLQLTLPPMPQAVWEIHRDIPQFTSTTQNVINSLVQKYGNPWTPYSVPGSPPSNPGAMQWLFDQQGNPVPSPTTQADSLAMTTCIGQTMQIWYMAFGNLPTPAGSATSNSLVPGNPRTSTQTLPPPFDPGKNMLCNNLILVKALINGGVVQPGDLRFTLSIQIDDFGLQHRTGIALNDQLNAIVSKGAQQERNNAQQQAVPKL